jgi:K+-sensing histidine kinase KdpD
MLLEKSGQDRISISIEPVDCHEVLKSATISNFGKNNIQMQCPENLFVFADQNVLRIILTNLVDNACKYGAKNKTIVVAAQETESERIELSVSNAVGPYGQPDPSLVFSKYYRSPSVVSVSGSGLGLYLIDTLANLIDSKVHYDNSQTDTICFKMTLTRANSEI